jgi:ATP-dependent RNA circularization protein (DNA/RNA ligase family)
MMKEYHKIDTLFKRDMESRRKTLIVGDWSQDVFGYLANNDWEFTEKVDGTNIRVMIADGNIAFGGKTDNASIPTPLVKRLEERFLSQKDDLLAKFPDGACLYGEGYGAKIQNGGNYRQDQDFVLFDVRIGMWWLQRPAIEDIAKAFGLDVVPIIGHGTLHDAVDRVQNGFTSTWGPFMAEGIVARPSVELMTRNGTRIITKIKHRDFSPS